MTQHDPRNLHDPAELDDRALERLLAPEPVEPPPELLAQLQDGIPELPTRSTTGPQPSRAPHRHAPHRHAPHRHVLHRRRATIWLAAASLAALTATSALLWRMGTVSTPSVSTPSSSDQAEARPSLQEGIPSSAETPAEASAELNTLRESGPGADISKAPMAPSTPISPPPAELAVPPPPPPPTVAEPPGSGPARPRARAAAPAAPMQAAPAPGAPTQSAPMQSASGLLTGVVTDDIGDLLPGVTVTVNPASGDPPLMQLTDTRGRFVFRDLDAGQYTLLAELEGFSRVERPAIPVLPQRQTTVKMVASAMINETILVSSESPLLDERSASGDTVGIAELERLSEARDPWTISRQTPGTQADRINIGGERAKRAESGAWALDGVVITNMGSVGTSPTYYSFDKAEEAASQAQPSTGGTAEPNDAPYGDVFFEDYGTNPFLDTEDDNLSTFGLDVDTGSAGIVRRYLRDGNLPPKDAVRVEELINAHDYGDAPPTDGDFAIHAAGAPSIYGEGERYHLLRFNLHAREIDAADRKPAVLTFVVDVSGSMAQENRLELVKRALHLLLAELREDDRVGLVVYGSQGRVVLEPSSDLERVRWAIDQLQTEGATNAEEGLRLAYATASRHLRRGTLNRVILCSDGVANVGNTGPASILETIREHAEEGIELTTLGFGMGNYNDVLMEQLANRGNGRYAYIDTLKEARKLFVEELTGTLQTVAAEARVQVEFNPAVVARYRLIGYENRAIADEDFRNDAIDAGEVGAGHTVTALYEIKLHHEGISKRDEVATLHLRWASMEAGEIVETSRTVTGADFAKRWEKAPRELRLTSLVAELGEILRGSYWAREGDLEDVVHRLQAIAFEAPRDTELAGWIQVAAQASELRAEESPAER